MPSHKSKKGRSQSEGDDEMFSPIGTRFDPEHTFTKSTIFEGLVYSGSIKDGLRDGRGCLKSKSGIIKYDGEWKEDKINGYGKLFISVSGDRYEGHFRNGKMHGLGLYLYASGDKYKGEWANGEKLFAFL